MSTPNTQSIKFPIIDSHIHLYASTHIPDLAWTASLPTTHPLNRQNSITEYLAASTSQPHLHGFIFIETDRKSSLSPTDWHHALSEIDFLVRIKTGTPNPAEGHNPKDASLLLGAVPWAPLPATPDVFTSYLDQVSQRTNTSSYTANTNLIKGFRYLFQDKPPGTQLNPHVVANLSTLESRGYKTFDLGVDFHRHGPAQLREAISMLSRFYASSGSRTLNVVINHLCKPDLSGDPAGRERFKDWSTCIRELAGFPTTYMKLSGLFSELDGGAGAGARTVGEVLEVIRPYVRFVFEVFGAERIMFGSDWPVCNAGAQVEGLGDGQAWMGWVDVVRVVLEDVGCSEEEMGMVWGGTASRVYGIDGVDEGGR